MAAKTAKKKKKNKDLTIKVTNPRKVVKRFFKTFGIKVKF